jgi:hypothetical protein
MDTLVTLATAVVKGAPNTFIVGDMPFLSYEISKEKIQQLQGNWQINQTIKHGILDSKLKNFQKSLIYIDRFNHYYKNVGKIKDIDKLMAEEFYSVSNRIMTHITSIGGEINNDNVKLKKEYIKKIIIQYQKLLTIPRVHWYTNEYLFGQVSNYIINGFHLMIRIVTNIENLIHLKPDKEFNSLCLKFIENVTNNFHKMKGIIQSPGYPHFVEKD